MASTQVNTKALVNKIRKMKSIVETPKFIFREYAFQRQIEIFKTQATRFNTVVTSRRFGKTCGITGDMLDITSNNPGVTVLYLTTTKENVRKILWHGLKELMERYKIEAKYNDRELEVYFPNGSRILTGGAKDLVECEKYRGLKLKRIYIDEAQSFRSHLGYLINDVLIPCLRDLRGDLFLIGTPGPTKTGAFYEYSQNPEWTNQIGTAFQNPYMHNPIKGLDLHVTLEEERRVRGILESDASYRRETYGEWVEDEGCLVLNYDKNKNNFITLPNARIDYIIGIDIGYEDSDAIAVLGYCEELNECYLIDEKECPKQDITALAEVIKYMQAYYKPMKTVMDCGSLGRKVVEELKNRHHLHIEAAEKDRKNEYLEFLNSDLKRGFFKARHDGIFAEDSRLVMWDKSTPDKWSVSRSYHSDIMDAVLYAYRHCLHYIQMEKNPKPKAANQYSDEYMDKYEQELSNRVQAQLEDPELYEYDQILDQYYSDF